MNPRHALALGWRERFIIAIHQYVATPDDESRSALRDLMWRYEDAIRRGEAKPQPSDPHGNRLSPSDSDSTSDNSHH